MLFKLDSVIKVFYVHGRINLVPLSIQHLQFFFASLAPDWLRCDVIEHISLGICNIWAQNWNNEGF